jgi:hypothetical protein
VPERLDALSRQLFPSDENHCGISGSSSEASLVPVTNGSSGEMILKARTLGLERDGTAGGGFVIDYEVDISVKAMESLVPAMVHMRRDEEVLQHVMLHQRNAAKLSQSGRVTAEIHVVHPFWTFRSAFCVRGARSAAGLSRMYVCIVGSVSCLRHRPVLLAYASGIKLTINNTVRIIDMKT